MTDANWITVDAAEKRFHTTADELRALCKEGALESRRKEDSNGFLLYVDRDEVAKRFPKRSTKEKYKEQVPTAAVAAATTLLVDELFDIGRSLREVFSEKPTSSSATAGSSNRRASSNQPSGKRQYVVNGLSVFLSKNGIEASSFLSGAGVTYDDYKRATNGTGVSFDVANSLYSSAALLAREQKFNTEGLEFVSK